jgi:hypothetical protein
LGAGAGVGIAGKADAGSALEGAESAELAAPLVRFVFNSVTCAAEVSANVAAAFVASGTVFPATANSCARKLHAPASNTSTAISGFFITSLCLFCLREIFWPTLEPVYCRGQFSASRYNFFRIFSL